MSLSRRDFVRSAGTALGAFPLAQLVSGCAGVNVYRVDPSNEIRMDLASMNELSVEAGTALLSIGEARVFLVRYNPTTYFTMSAICTFGACQLQEKRSRF